MRLDRVPGSGVNALARHRRSLPGNGRTSQIVLLANMKMVAGDFDGDGRSDVAVFYRTGSTSWDYRVLLSTSTPDNIVFAAPAVWSVAGPGSSD
jgi:hypothetical protein